MVVHIAYSVERIQIKIMKITMANCTYINKK